MNLYPHHHCMCMSWWPPAEAAGMTPPASESRCIWGNQARNGVPRYIEPGAAWEIPVWGDALVRVRLVNIDLALSSEIPRKPRARYAIDTLEERPHSSMERFPETKRTLHGLVGIPKSHAHTVDTQWGDSALLRLRNRPSTAPRIGLLLDLP